MKPELQRRVQRYGWDKAAKFYEDSWKTQLKPAQDKLLDLAALKPGERVLDIACGTGLVTFRAAGLIEPGGEIVATDISDTMLVLSKTVAEEQGIHNVTFRRMDAEKLDFEDRQFDAVLCGLGLMYVPDPLQSMKEAFRVLKQGGRAVFAIWGERNRCGWAEIFPIVDQRVATDVCPLFFQQGTGETLTKTFQMAGFENVRSYRLSVNLHYSTPDEAVMAAFSGGPVALAYHKFDNMTKESVHREYLESISPFRNGYAFEIPGEFVVAIGRKKE